MVKVPATPAGIPAIRELIGEGMNINITLLFSVERLRTGGRGLYRRPGGSGAGRRRRVQDRQRRQLFRQPHRHRGRQGGWTGSPTRRLADRLRGKVGHRQRQDRLRSLQGAVLRPALGSLAAAGAKTQRLLWASTSTKDPAYKDTLYVEALIGRDTVDTIPPATMDAFRDHGVVEPDAIEQDVDGRARDARRAGAARHLAGRDHRRAGRRRRAAVRRRLRQAVRRHRATAAARCSKAIAPTSRIEPGSAAMKAAFDAEMEAWRKDGRIRRLWAGDKTLWTGADEDKWGGWLDIVEQELADIDQLHAFAEQVKANAASPTSCCWAWAARAWGRRCWARPSGQQPGWPRFHMLDSTDPAQIRRSSRRSISARRCSSSPSKSGSTLEPNIFMDYFFDRVGAVRGKDKAGEHFVAVTDPGSSLEQRAKELRFAHIFYGVPSIGGRYSVLSKFGLVPAAAMGIDVKRLLETTQPMERACGADVPPAENPGVQLGVAMGVAASRFGRDKVTIIASPGIADLGAWLEQLLAESTGKQGRGLIPLAGEPLTTPERYGSDRFFAYLELDGQADPSQRQAVEALERPAIRSPASASRTSGTSARNFSAGRSPPPSPARSSASIRSTSRMSRRARTRPAR